jgi:long-subunit acyl-CoA synthetase (AMP-forming)
METQGLTESATVVSATSTKDILLGSSGNLISGVEVRLQSLSNDSEIHEYETPGELYVRSPSITTLGYLNNPEATAETFTKGGWLRTGDEAMIVLNSAGNGKPTEHLKIVDRIKELIKYKVRHQHAGVILHVH